MKPAMYFTYWICLCFPFYLFGQTPNVLVMGAVQNDSMGYLILEINKKYIDNTIVEHAVGINEEGKFGVACQLELPQLASVKYKGELMSVFLEPGDTLYLDIDGATFPKGTKFANRGGDNNELWQAYLQSFPKDPNIFKHRQYKKGIYYYKIHEDWDELMRKNNPDQYTHLLRRELMQKKGFVQLFQQQKGRHITDGFLDFMKGELYYDHAFKKLAYGHIYKGMHRLDDAFLDFMDTIVIQNDQSLGNPIYREFMLASTNFWCEQNGWQWDSLYVQQYRMAQRQYEGMTRYFMMAHILEKALKKEEVEEVLPIYEDFLQENPYLELDRLAVDAFQRARQFAAGTPVPTFSLQDKDGNTVSLRDFQGKVIYLDFWASWCRPCMKKMYNLKPIEAAFEGKDIVFLHVSLDREASTWRETVERNQFGGIHVLNNANSTITQDFNVLSVPKFFVITREGNFALTPTSSDEQVLIELLEGLLER